MSHEPISTFVPTASPVVKNVEYQSYQEGNNVVDAACSVTTSAGSPDCVELSASCCTYSRYVFMVAFAWAVESGEEAGTMYSVVKDSEPFDGEKMVYPPQPSSVSCGVMRTSSVKAWDKAVFGVDALTEAERNAATTGKEERVR